MYVLFSNCFQLRELSWICWTRAARHRKRNGRNEYQREADADNRFHLNLMPMKDEPRRRRILNEKVAVVVDGEIGRDAYALLVQSYYIICAAYDAKIV